MRDGLDGHAAELLRIDAPSAVPSERRFYGSGFLELAAFRLGRPELEEAAAHFRVIHALMERVWAVLGGMHGPEAHLRLGDARVREAIAGLLRDMAREDAEAAALLAR